MIELDADSGLGDFQTQSPSGGSVGHLPATWLGAEALGFLSVLGFCEAILHFNSFLKVQVTAGCGGARL